MFISGKHTSTIDFSEGKKIHARFKHQRTWTLGSGGQAIVTKVQFSHNNRTIWLARKRINSRQKLDFGKVREEAAVLERLCHDHIVNVVGTYTTGPRDFFILLWPVAVCDLHRLFDDLEHLRCGDGERDEIVARLEALELRDLEAFEHRQPKEQAYCGHSDSSPQRYLREIMGCITRAVAYCHKADVRHLDLKPQNILLCPGRVYLADFGIAKDVNNWDNTMASDAYCTPKWSAPEVYGYKDCPWSMRAADVYSLGLVLLNTATMLYGASLAEFDAVIGERAPQERAEKLSQFQSRLRLIALATQDLDDVDAPTFTPKHVVNLTSSMLSSNPSDRPRADQVDIELVELGGIEQVYHASCCKRNSRFVTDRMNAKFRRVVLERNRLRDDYEAKAKKLEVLERKDETYEARIHSEQRANADRIANLQEQLKKERKERERVESMLAGMQRGGKKPAQQDISRVDQGRKVFGTGPAANGLTMAAKPRIHSAPIAASQSPAYPAPPVQRLRTPTVTFNSRPSYSQAASIASANLAASQLASQRTGPISPAGPVSHASAPSPLPPSVANGSPSFEQVGFPLRSRNSGSRLPQPVNPATPIRSNTPIVYRDPSSTDSTEHSMTSSIFSQRSGSRYAESTAATSVGGTPVIGGLSSGDKKGANGHVPEGASNNDDAASNTIHTGSEGIGLGLDFGSLQQRFDQRRDSVATTATTTDAGGAGGGGSIRGGTDGDAASVISSHAPTSVYAGSVFSGGSVMSSPKALHATIEPSGARPSAAYKIPSLPTAKSWADVARRQQRPVKV